MTYFRVLLTVVSVCVLISFAGTDLRAQTANLKPFVRGDANTDGSVDVSDAILTLLTIFARPEELPCRDAADANADLAVDIADPIYGLNFLFGNGPPPPAPYPDCGFDSSGNGLGCAEYTGPGCVTIGREETDRVIGAVLEEAGGFLQMPPGSGADTLPQGLAQGLRQAARLFDTMPDHADVSDEGTTYLLELPESLRQAAASIEEVSYAKAASALKRYAARLDGLYAVESLADHPVDARAALIDAEQSAYRLAGLARFIADAESGEAAPVLDVLAEAGKLSLESTSPSTNGGALERALLAVEDPAGYVDRFAVEVLAGGLADHGVALSAFGTQLGSGVLFFFNDCPDLCENHRDLEILPNGNPYTRMGKIGFTAGSADPDRQSGMERFLRVLQEIPDGGEGAEAAQHLIKHLTNKRPHLWVKVYYRCCEDQYCDFPFQWRKAYLDNYQWVPVHVAGLNGSNQWDSLDDWTDDTVRQVEAQAERALTAFRSKIRRNNPCK